MAPSQVFSYFRSHRKQLSTPTSPNNPSQNTVGFPQSFEPLQTPPSFNIPAVDSPSSASPISPLPPTLPSIRRVSSYRHADGQSSLPPATIAKGNGGSKQEKELPRPPTQPQPHSGDSDPMPDRAAAAYAPIRPFQTRQSNVPVAGTLPQASRDVSRRPVTPASHNAQLQGDAQNRQHLAPPHNSSPTSSFSSVPKSTSSTNLAVDSSPASSRSAQVPPGAAPKPTKSKINLLNPVSLLMRRRAAQSSSGESEKIPTYNQMDVPAMNLPKDYDPRIRGKGVHDFSAPRPRRNVSSTDLSPGATQPSDVVEASVPGPSPGDADRHLSNDSGKSPEKEHTAVFTEHFDDDGPADAQTHTAAVHRESLANPTFLARISRQLDYESPEYTAPTSKPEQQKQPPDTATPATAGERTSRSTDVPSYRASSDQSTARSSFSNETKATSPPLSPTSQTPSRASLSLDLPLQTSGLPTHLPSNASRTSRFSFQLNSDRSVAQEKALEEKHKQKHPPQPIKPDSIVESVYEETDEDDMSDYDMDDEAFEERIPGVNADMSDDEPAPFNDGLQDAILDQSEYDSGYNQHEDEEGGGGSDDDGLDAISLGEPHQDVASRFNNGSLTRREEPKASVNNDDMYFDDGLIEEPASGERGDFDESLFDSPEKEGRRRRSIDGVPRSNARGSALDAGPNASSDFNLGTAGANGQENGTTTKFDPTQSNVKPHRLSIPTKNEADDYQRALASAAMRAEAAGKFRRQRSTELASADGSSVYDDDLAQDLTGSYVNDDERPPWAWNDEEDLDDDPMVAAANAEALAADDSGFYGREFGFYGNAADGDEAWNGGFFGMPGDGLGRSTSGHNASREPNLTPITERSEFSTRNSFISLSAMGGPLSGSNVSIPLGSREQAPGGPGLKELASSAFDDEELTLSQLIKLRKEAFGGRSASAGASTSSSPSTTFSSPLAMNSYSAVPPPETPTVEEEDFSFRKQEDVRDRASSHPEPRLATFFPPSNSYSHDAILRAPRMYNQAFASDDGPTTTPSAPFGIAANAHSLPSPFASTSVPVSPASAMPVPMPSPALVQKFAARPPASSESFAQRQQRARHQRNSHGGSDSVTYVREDDDSQGTRWYLERRRRMSTGEVVVLGRELVEGGRI